MTQRNDYYALEQIEQAGQKKRPTPADFGIPMTLCIAAIGRQAKQIVCAADFMISTDFMSTDTSVVKIEPFSGSNRWLMMFAGSPSVMAELSKEVRNSLAGLKKEDETLAAVSSAFISAYRDQLKKKIEGEILSPFGWDRETFLREGRESLGDDEFSRILYGVKSARLETTFMVAGWDEKGWPRLFCISDPGTIEHHDRLGFYAIGTGYVRALGSLYGNYDTYLKLPQLVYRVCEAKFLGESALGVGKKTFVVAIRRDGYQMAMYPEQAEKIKPIWEQKGRPIVPNEAESLISKELGELGWKASDG